MKKLKINIIRAVTLSLSKCVRRPHQHGSTGLTMTPRALTVMLRQACTELVEVKHERKGLLTIVFILMANAAIAQHRYNGSYAGLNNNRVAYPIGGIGGGMFTLEGTGAMTHVSVRNNPDMFNEPELFAAVYVKGKGAKVLEGPVPGWKKFGLADNARGGEGKTWGLTRFDQAKFSSRFPFGISSISDPRFPVKATITGWSPFIPTDADDASLPVGALEYTLTNTSKIIQSGVFSFNSENFIATDEKTNGIKATKGGFILSQEGTKQNPEKQGDLAIWTDEANVSVDHCWFRGGWIDPLTMCWKKITEGDTKAVAAVERDAPGASLYVPFTLKPGQSKTIKVLMAWYVPYSRIRYGVRSEKKSDTTIVPNDKLQPSPFYMPWYAGRFKNINEVIGYWSDNYAQLRANTQKFTNTFYSSTLPPEVLEAVSANLSILKSPTCLRQYDGRFWGWEGSNDRDGSCAGNCTHVYNYEQALPHLFPSLERSIRETELNEGMDAFGHMNYRMAMPIKPEGHDVFLPAADGQLGSIMRAYRDWRISSDDAWLKKLWPKLKVSMDYCIQTWDPDRTGTLMEPHHNTYDIEFWGADGMGTSYYLGALEAFMEMAKANGNTDLGPYQVLFDKGRTAMNTKLWNGEYFIQNVQWKGLHNDPLVFHNTAEGAPVPLSPEAKALLDKEGPKYQYGKGCLSDGVIGGWLGKVCGLPDFMDESKVKSHLASVYRYNFKTDLSDFSNPQRSTYALGHEGGLLLCTWPKGGALSLPFVYSNEVWTGIEYQVASHLIMEGRVKEGLNIVKATRKRYDGSIRNPYDEYECGHFYMRAMSSYALLQALTGLRYDAVTKTLYVNSRIGDFTCFLSTNTGFGTVSLKQGKVTFKVAYGHMDIEKTVKS